MKKLENKTAVIISSTGSIGKTKAKLFLAQIAKVMLVDLDEKSSKKTGEDKVDVLFNNASIEGMVKPVTEYPKKISDKVMAVNVKGVWLGSSIARLGVTPHVSTYAYSYRYYEKLSL